MQIFVRTANGACAVDVNASESIEIVKARIAQSTGVPVASQELSFAGRILDDLSTVADYDISAEATLELAVPLLGGEI